MSNLISAEITEEAIGTAKIKIEELKQSLPFLIAIPAGEKQRKRTMGQKSVEKVYSRKCKRHTCLFMDFGKLKNSPRYSRRRHHTNNLSFG